MLDIDREELELSKQFIKKINFTSPSVSIPIFEMTIRCLAPLISVYELTNYTDAFWINKAIELADIMMESFDPQSNLFYHKMQSSGGHFEYISWADNSALLAESGSCQLEYAKLSQLTGNPKYKEKAMLVFDQITEAPHFVEGLVATKLRKAHGTYDKNFFDYLPSQKFTWGAWADSYYEYLLSGFQDLKNISPQEL